MISSGLLPPGGGGRSELHWLTGQSPVGVETPMVDETRPTPHRRQVIDARTLVEILQTLSPEARKELITFLRSGSLPIPAEDSLTLVRVADLLEMLLT